jgi:hypothetical protein
MAQAVVVQQHKRPTPFGCAGSFPFLEERIGIPLYSPRCRAMWWRLTTAR